MSAFHSAVLFEEVSQTLNYTVSLEILCFAFCPLRAFFLSNTNALQQIVGGGSYRPFIPLRNLWSRRDILPRRFTDGQLFPSQKQATLLRKELCSCMWSSVVLNGSASAGVFYVLFLPSLYLHSLRGFLCT